MDKEKLLDLLDRQTFAYHEMQPESPEDYTVEYKKGYNEGLKFAIAYIDQLDEPEDCTEALLDLGQTLIRVQAERDEAEKELRELKDMYREKVIVPDFVFNHIEKYKDRGLSLWSAMRDSSEYELKPWMTGPNQDLYARAWIGYPNIEVEKNQKYIVKDDKGNILLRKVTKGFGIGNRKGEVVHSLNVGESSGIKLTEKEIKDYDERYWPFAEEVES